MKSVMVKNIDPIQVRELDLMCEEVENGTVIFFAPKSGIVENVRLRRMERLVAVLLKCDEATFDKVMTAVESRFGAAVDDPDGVRS